MFGANSELADNLGNFINRALKFAQQSFGNRVPALDRESLTESELKLENAVNEQLQLYIQKLERSNIKEGVKIAMAISKLGNQYLQDCKPWVLVKENMKRCGVVIATAVSLSKLLALLVWPYMPFLSANVLYNQLNIPRDGYPSLPAEFKLPFVPSDHELGDPQPLFRKISDDEIKALRVRFGGEAAAAGEPFPLDLRVGDVSSVENHPEADNLYVLKISFGDSERTVVAGVRAHYTAEALLGRKVVVCCNLKPTKFKGINSEGMLLAASKNDKIVLLVPTAAAAGDKLTLTGYANPDAKAPKFDGKKVKSLAFEITSDGLKFKGVPFAAGTGSVTVKEEGDWNGAKIY
jgi:methionyl-tRNA synthetase